MWNQWGSMSMVPPGMPPMPSSAAPTQPVQPPLPNAPPPPANTATHSVTSAVPFIGPTMPNFQPNTSVSSVTTPAVGIDQSNPYSQYTAAQYAAMTPEQQYALQQHWQQWQAYQQEYAKWHAQYGEQYKREMAAAAAATGISGATSYPGYFQQQSTLQLSQQPPLPPPVQQEDAMQRQNSGQISSQPQMYNKPPPPLPQNVPVTGFQQNQWQQQTPNMNVNFNQPPPPLRMQSQLSSYQNQYKQNAPSIQINTQQPPPNIIIGNQKPLELPGSSSELIGADLNSTINQQKLMDYQNKPFNEYAAENTHESKKSENKQSKKIEEFDEVQNYKEEKSINYDESVLDRSTYNEKEFRGNHSSTEWMDNIKGTDSENTRRINEFESNGTNNYNNKINNPFQDKQYNWNKSNDRENVSDQDDNFEGSSFHGRNDSFRKSWQNNSLQNYRNNNKQDIYQNSGNYSNWKDNANTQQDEYSSSNRWCTGRNQYSNGISDRVKQNENNNEQRKPPDLDEDSFDKQFRQWEEQFENWKLANANNPDREEYLQYEREFEKQRRRIIERRDLMRKRKMERMGLCNQNSSDKIQTPSPLSNEVSKKETSSEIKEKNLYETKKFSQTEDNFEKIVQEDKKEENILPSTDEKIHDKLPKIQEKESKKIYETNEEQTKLSRDSKKIILGKRKSRFNSPQDESFKNKEECENIINLDEDTDDEITRKKTPDVNDKSHINEIFEKPAGIPGLDLVDNPELKQTDENLKKNEEIIKEKPISNENESFGTAIQSNLLTKTNKKIPSLFDIVIEDPLKSPNHLSVVNQSGNTGASVDEQNLPFLNSGPTVANALQDPNILENITKALAHIQSIPNQTANLVKNPEILEKLPALLQIVQQQQQHKLTNDGMYINNSGAFDGNMSGMNSQYNSNFAPNFVGNISNMNSAHLGGGHFNDRDNNYLGNFQNNFSNQSRNDCNINFNRNDQCYNNDRNLGRNDRNFRGNGRNLQQRNRFNDNNRNHNKNQSNDKRRNFGVNYRGGGGGVDRSVRSNRSNSKNRDSDTIEDMNDSRKIDSFGQRTSSDGSKLSNVHNPFRSGPSTSNFDNHSGGQKPQGNTPWKNDSGNGEYFISNMRIFEYQNNGTIPAKVIDYGHKPVVKSDDEYKPVKTIDYGHASKVNNKNNQNKKFKENESDIPSKNDEKQKSTRDSLVKTNVNKQSVEVSCTSKKDDKKRDAQTTSTLVDADDNRNVDSKSVFNKEDLEEISDTEEDYINKDSKINVFVSGLRRDRSESPPPPPPPMYSLDKPISLFPLTGVANESLCKLPEKHIHMTLPTMDNHNTISIDEIIAEPGRSTRSKKICIIMRGPPGSGKSYVAKLLKEKEMAMENSDVRILSIDDYFIIENEYEDICPKTGKKIPKKELLYEYDKDMEETYLQYLIKAFKKTISDNLYDFIIVDCNNSSLRSLNEFYCYSKEAEYMPYIIDLKCDVDTCLNRNIHERTQEDIVEIINNWNETPLHYLKLDVSSILDNTIEMEDAHDMVMEHEPEIENTKESIEINEIKKGSISEVNDDESNDTNDPSINCGFLRSKWENDTTSENLARLDGITKSLSKRKAASMEDYLQLEEWQPSQSKDGKKRVRWADIEERRHQDKMRAIGFVVGQTDWKRMMDPNAGRRALNKTKYIERVNKRRF